jgi:hypothetical protein
MVFHGILRGYVRFEVFTAVTVKNGVFWHITPCGVCKNRRFAGTYRLVHPGDKNWWTRDKALAVTSSRRTLRRNTTWHFFAACVLVTTSVVPISPILVTLLKEALISCETFILTNAARRIIPEDAILQFWFVWVDDVRTSHETPLWTITACYWDSFVFLSNRSYLQFVRYSDENW